MAIAGCCGGGFFLIVTLLAFLFPIQSARRERALQATCMSHVRYNQQAIQMYVEDNDEHLPQATKWMDLIQPFEKASLRESLRCPEVMRSYPDDRHKSRRNASDDQPDEAALNRLKYGYAFDSRLDGVALSGITSPATTRATFDSRNLDRNATDSGNSLAPRHNERAVVGYLDGHAGLVEGPHVE